MIEGMEREAAIDSRREPFQPPALEQKHGETEVVISSSITVIELERGLHRANTPATARQRRAYLDAIFPAIPVEPFTQSVL